jgi:hypothetical protein
LEGDIGAQRELIAKGFKAGVEPKEGIEFAEETPGQLAAPQALARAKKARSTDGDEIGRGETPPPRLSRDD